MAPSRRHRGIARGGPRIGAHLRLWNRMSVWRLRHMRSLGHWHRLWHLWGLCHWHRRGSSGIATGLRVPSSLWWGHRLRWSRISTRLSGRCSISSGQWWCPIPTGRRMSYRWCSISRRSWWGPVSGGHWLWLRWRCTRFRHRVPSTTISLRKRLFG